MATVTPLRAGILAGLCALAFIGATMNLGMWGWANWYRLARKGQKTEARVTAIRPEFHQECYFEFSIGTTAHKGSALGCPAAVGDVINVFYLPNDPALVTLRNPKEELVGRVAGSLGMSVFAGLVVGIRTRGWQGNQP